MAQINVYGAPGSASRACVRYHSGQDVQVGIQQSREANDDGAPVMAGTVWDELGGYWHDLDRAGINNLIRALREARDKAYGRDE